MFNRLNNSSASLIRNEDSGNAINFLHQALLSLPRSLMEKGPTRAEDLTEGEAGQPASFHYYPRLKCDEGMHAFSHPMFIQPLCSDLKVANATICFNIGLAYTRLQEDEEALLWFNKALYSNRFSQTNEQDKSSDMSNAVNRTAINSILHNIGHVHWRAGRYEDAITIYSQALEILLPNLNPLMTPKRTLSVLALNTQETILHISANLNCIAVSRCYLNDYDKFPANETLDLLERALAIHKEATGGGAYAHNRLNREAATILNNIGRVKFTGEDFSGALVVYQETNYRRRTLLGEDHLDVAVSHYNIAEAHNRLDNVEDAIHSYKQFLSIALPKLGHDHADIAEALKNIGQLYLRIKDYDKAIDYLSRAMTSFRLAFGRNHESVAFMLNLLGNATFSAGMMDAAFQAYNTGLLIERTLENSEDNVVLTLLNIANITELQGKYTEATEYYKEALTLLRAKGNTRDKEAEVLSCMALLYGLQGENSLAAARLNESIGILKELFGSQSFEVSSALNTLGLLQFKQGNTAGALDSFLGSLRIRSSMRDLSPNYISTVCNNVASAYQRIGDTEKALHFYNETLLLDRKSAAVSANYCPKNTLSCLQQTASIYKQRKEFEKALKCYEEAVCLSRRTMDLEDISKAVGDLYLFKEFMLFLDEYSSKHCCAPAA